MPENYNLGTAYGTIELNASSLSRAAAGFDLLSNKMLLLGGAALAGFGYAVKSAADFEQQMSRFEAVGNATANQMDKIKEKALQLGRDSAYGATQVVQAFAELAYAGASVHEIMSGLGDATVYLAAAGEIPLADAAKDLIVTMDQFGIKGKGATNIADELARSANASTASISDLVTSLRYAGTVAGPLGFQFRDVAQTLAILANAGLRGSTAGTSLRGILIGLTPTSDKAAAAMKKLGLITLDGSNQFFDAAGHIKSMADISQILHDATKNLSDEQKKEAFSTIFQRRAMASAIVLARGGKGAFDDLAASQQYNTTAQEIMKTKLDNLNGSIKILKASFETFAIVIGEKFTPYLKVAADILRQVVNAFIRLPGPVQTAIGAVLALGGGTLVLAGTLGKISSIAIRTYAATNNLGKGFQLLGGLLRNFVAGMQLLGTTLLTNPIFLFIVVLVALAVIFYLLYTRSETFRRGIQRIGEAAKEAARWLLQAFKVAWEWIKRNWPDLVFILLGPLGVALIAWRHFKDQIIGAVNTALNWIKRNWDLLTPILLGPFGLFIIFIRRWGDDVVRIIGNMVGKVIGFITRIPFYFGYVIGYLIGAVVVLNVRLVQLFIRLWNKLLDLLFGFTVSFGNHTSNFLQRLPGLFVRTFEQIITFLINFVEQAVAKIIDLGVRVIAAIIQFFSQLPGLIWGFLLAALGFILSWGAQVVSAIINTGAQVLAQAFAFFSQLPGQILGALGDAYSLLYNWGKQLVTGLIDGIKSLAQHAIDIVGDIGHGISSGFGKAIHALSPSKDFIEHGQNIVQGLIIGLKRETKNLEPVTMAMRSSVGGPGAFGGNRWREAGYKQPQHVHGDTNITVNNPVAEPAEESISRTMQKLAYVGIAG